MSFRFSLTYLFQYKEEKSALVILNLPLWDFSKGLKNKFETAMVDKLSMVGHKICFYRQLWIIIPKLSLLPILMWSIELNYTDGLHVCGKLGRVNSLLKIK